MSIKVMTWVWDVSPYTGAGLLMHLALADWSNDDGVCWPNQQQIADKIRGSVENVRRLTRKMEADGWLVISEPSTGKGNSHTYRLALEVPAGTHDTATPTDCGPTPVSPTTGGGTQESFPHISSSFPHISSEIPPQLVPNNRQEPSEVQPSKTDPANAALSLLIPVDMETEMFNVFWDVYPRHEGKQAARKAWAKAIKAANPVDIVNGALRYREDPNREQAFTAHPSTWLNGHRWEDDPLPARPGSQPSGTALYLATAEGFPGYDQIAIES